MEKILSENVRRICRERKIQLKDLAASMGVDPASLNRALKFNARLDTIEKMAKALDVSIKSLFEPTDGVEGFIRVGKNAYKFNSMAELRKILENNGQTLGY